MNNSVYQLDIETYIEIVELAQSKGKVAGDDMTDEFKEIMEKKKDKIKYLGTTKKDADLMTGEIREEGIKVLNLKEGERRRGKSK